MIVVKGSCSGVDGQGSLMTGKMLSMGVVSGAACQGDSMHTKAQRPGARALAAVARCCVTICTSAVAAEA